MDRVKFKPYQVTEIENALRGKELFLYVTIGEVGEGFIKIVPEDFFNRIKDYRFGAFSSITVDFIVAGEAYIFFNK